MLAACARDGAAVVASRRRDAAVASANAPRRCDVALHTHGLRGIRGEYDPRDMTGRHRSRHDAGTKSSACWANTGSGSPFDAPQPARATVGGTLAAGWAGPRRAAYGRLRDLVIGSTVALTDGTAGARRRDGRQKRHRLRHEQTLPRFARHPGADRAGEFQDAAASGRATARRGAHRRRSARPRDRRARRPR